ncbi:hypothetical protein BMG05_11080 [Mycobacterium malmoense]|nr:hypothetical protein BMG05_11080 [Mycobacterium malmoense]
MTSIQNGQSDLELAGRETAVLMVPFTGSSPLTNLEASGGGLDPALFTNLISVGNYTKKDGVKLSNNPTINDIKSSGKGSPTRQIASESAKGISFVPQELKAINVQNYWGIPASAFNAPSANGGITVGIPDLPANLLWRVVLLGYDDYNGEDVWIYWIANKVSVGKRTDQSIVDSNVLEHGVDLTFLVDNAVGLPVIFGVCGQGWQTLNGVNDSGFGAAVSGITLNAATAALTVAAGAGHTKQLQVLDSNGIDVTDQATYTTSASGIATVSTLGLITAVAAGSATITAAFDGFTATCAVTAS